MIKNIIINRFPTGINMSVDELQTYLENWQFESCQKHQPQSVGWVPLVSTEQDRLAIGIQGCISIKFCKEEKLLPASVVKEYTDEKVAAIVAMQSRKVKAAERKSIKEQVEHELLPRAFTKTTYFDAYIDNQNGWFVVDTSSAKKSEEVADFLRKTLGSLDAIPFEFNSDISELMTGWLRGDGDCPNELELGIECVLEHSDGAKATCKKQDLASEEIDGLIQAGKIVKRLGLEYNTELSFTLDDKFIIRQLKLLDVIEGGDGASDDEYHKFQSDFIIMQSVATKLINELTEVFGGIKKLDNISSDLV